MFLSVVSPSKKINFASFVPENVQRQVNTPKYGKQAWELAQIMKKYNAQELMDILKISPKLSQLNYERYLDFSYVEKSTEDKLELMPAMYAFQGDTFIGLEASTLKEEEQNYSNKALRILSGLYGLLAPFDNIQAYRLEMGTKLQNSQGADLYAYWSELLTADLNAYIKENNITKIINLASVEYSSVLDKSKMAVEIITPDFKNLVNGVLKPCGMFVKRYRGMMARYIIQNQVCNVEKLKKFNFGGLQLYDEDNLLFVKEKS